ncbi:hypothetical protein ABLL29_004571 [Salmonella enterica subsp. enterica]
MIIDEFLYALGFKTDTSGAKSFVSALGGVDQASQHTTGSMMKAVLAGSLLSDSLEKAAEGVKEFGADFVETARNLENTRITLESIYTTAAEGDEKFKWLWEFAKQNPFMKFDEATELFMALRNNGIDPTTQALKAFGDAAAAVPSVAKLIPQGIAELIEGRYMAGGVLSPLISLHGAGANRVYAGSYVNKAGQNIAVHLDFNNAKKATDQLIQILNDKFSGTMAKHAGTFEGLIRKGSNDFLQFKEDVMNSDVFAALKRDLKEFLDNWDEFAKTDGYDALVHNIAAIGAAIVYLFGETSKAAMFVINLFGTMKDSAEDFGHVLAVIFGAAGAMKVYQWGQVAVEAFTGILNVIRNIKDVQDLLIWGQTILDALMAPELLLAAAIGAALVEIGYQWYKFSNNQRTFMTDFIIGAEAGISGMIAYFDYFFDCIHLGFLKALNMVHQLDDAGKKAMNDLDDRLSKTSATKEASRAAEAIRTKEKIRFEGQETIDKIKHDHPDFNKEQTMEFFVHHYNKQFIDWSNAVRDLKANPSTRQDNSSKSQAAQDNSTSNSETSTHTEINITMTGVTDYDRQYIQNMIQGYMQNEYMTTSLNMGGGDKRKE